MLLCHDRGKWSPIRVLIHANDMKLGVELRLVKRPVISPSYTQHFERLWTWQQKQLGKLLRPTIVYLLVILCHPPTRTELVVVLTAKAALTSSNKCSQSCVSLHLLPTLVQSNTAGWCYHSHTQ